MATKNETDSGQEDSAEVQEKSSKSAKPSWMTMKLADVEKIVVELAKKGESPAKIGLILRDTHGIPKSKLVGKKITQILREHKISYGDDKNSVEKKTEKLKGHIGKNKHDYTASRALTKKLWALHRFENRTA